jgi:hypothetical protein
MNPRVGGLVPALATITPELKTPLRARRFAWHEKMQRRFGDSAVGIIDARRPLRWRWLIAEGESIGEASEYPGG